MKNIILLSGPDKTKYFNKEISQIIREKAKNPINMVVIPGDSNNYSKNDKHFNGNEKTVGIKKTFNKIFSDLNIYLLDSRVNSKECIKKIVNADIIYLLGGNPFTQLEYLHKNQFDEIIIESSALIIGVSAGSMNLAINSYYSKDEDYPESIIYKGLGITNITIDPHFDINDEEQVNEIKENSKKTKIIGLPNDSAIVISKNKVQYVGDVYIFEDGNLKI